MERHLRILAWLWIAYSVLLSLFILVIFLVVQALIAGFAVATAIAVASVMVSLALIPGVIGGIGLLERWSWARWLALALGVLHLANMPVGTLLGIYTLWVLLQADITRQFSSS